jgi:disulfide bond formation protein DsbB
MRRIADAIALPQPIVIAQSWRGVYFAGHNRQGHSEHPVSELLMQAHKDSSRTAAAVVAVIGALTIAGVYFFQYVLGYPPCPLCLDQRMAYYVCIPLAALLWLGAGFGASRKVLVLGFAAIAIAMLWNAGLSAYHAGVEWKLWAGPTDCSGPINNFGAASNMLNRLESIRIVRCDEAAWRFLGISLAGYDVLVSLFLAIVAAWGAKASFARPEE